MSAAESHGIDIYDPGWYASRSPHETFAELRRGDPVHWQDMPGEPGYWAILRHADVVDVSRHPETYSSWLGGVTLEATEPEVLEQTRHMLVVMDPPQHTAYRQPLAPHFAARVIGRIEAHMRDQCRAIFDVAAERAEVEELITTIDVIDVTDESARVRSNLNNGYKRLPMRLTR